MKVHEQFIIFLFILFLWGSFIIVVKDRYTAESDKNKQKQAIITCFSSGSQIYKQQVIVSYVRRGLIIKEDNTSAIYIPKNNCIIEEIEVSI